MPEGDHAEQGALHCPIHFEGLQHIGMFPPPDHPTQIWPSMGNMTTWWCLASAEIYIYIWWCLASAYIWWCLASAFMYIYMVVPGIGLDMAGDMKVRTISHLVHTHTTQPLTTMTSQKLTSRSMKGW